jgi:hypothetical protein
MTVCSIHQSNHINCGLYLSTISQVRANQSSRNLASGRGCQSWPDHSGTSNEGGEAVTLGPQNPLYAGSCTSDGNFRPPSKNHQCSMRWLDTPNTNPCLPVASASSPTMSRFDPILAAVHSENEQSYIGKLS